MKTRVDDFLDVVRNPDGPRLQGWNAVDDALRTMLVHLLYADEALSDDELGLARRLFQIEDDDDAVLAAVRDARKRPIDAIALIGAVPELEDRRKLVLFAQQVATADDEYADQEHAFIVQLRRSVQPAPHDGE